MKLALLAALFFSTLLFAAEEAKKSPAATSKKAPKIDNKLNNKLPRIPNARSLVDLGEYETATCNSTKEFRKTLEFLRGVKDFDTPEPTARKIADEVSKGCDGASARFAKIMLLTRKIGMSHYKSLETALKFSQLDTQTQKNFFVVFEKAYLSEYFNYDFKVAFDIAMSLSKNYQGNPKTARDDFIKLVDFCKNTEKLDLPINFCGKMAVEVAHLSQYYKKGVYVPFKKLYEKMRKDKNFGLSVKGAIDTSYRVLTYGPTAPKNFLEAFDYGMKKSGLGLGSREALTFAMSMAKRSVTEMPPPLVEYE